MTDPLTLATIAVVSLIGLGIVAGAALKAWHEWLELQRFALAGGRRDAGQGAPSVARIELADLRERVRKLEAIATGVDL